MLAAAKGTGIKYFVHGVEQENNHIHGGVGIMLNRKAAFAWKEAGLPEPIGSTLLSGTARFVSLDGSKLEGLEREDTTTPGHFFTHAHTSSFSAEQYEEVLEELEKKVLDGCKQEGRVPIIGADIINGSAGISKADEEEEEKKAAML